MRVLGDDVIEVDHDRDTAGIAWITLLRVEGLEGPAASEKSLRCIGEA